VIGFSSWARSESGGEGEGRGSKAGFLPFWPALIYFFLIYNDHRGIADKIEISGLRIRSTNRCTQRENYEKEEQGRTR